MKNQKPKTKQAKTKVIKELATQFEEDFKKTLPISIQPNGSIVYKQYLIKTNKQGDWCIHKHGVLDPLGTFYLKTSALMATRAYDRNNLNKMFEIERLDVDYKNNHTDSLVYANNIKKAKDFGRFMILLNKLEYSQERTEYFKDKISKMFKWSFV
jgi:uncharacterized protein involved in propanediol utilization